MTTRRRIPKRTASAVEKLYLAESSRLFRQALLLTQGDRSGAEDLVQKVFEAAATGWARVPRDDEDRRRWLFGVLRNKAVDLWRDSRVILQPEPIDGDREASLADDDPCALVAGSTSDEQLWKELKVMPPVRYQVAYLSWRCGWSAAEIAETLGITATTVRVHKHNAVMQLRSMTLQNLDIARTHEITSPEGEQSSGDQEETGGR